VLISQSHVLMTEGRIDEYIATLEKAGRLSPNDPGVFSELSWGFMWAHRFAEGIAAADRAIELAPDQDWPYLYRGINYMSWKGDCMEARAAFASTDQTYPWTFWALYNLALMRGNLEEVSRLVAALPDGWDIRKTETIPAVLYQAWIHQYQKETDLASAKFKEAAALLEKEVAAHPEDARYHSALGMALAGAGQKERAIRMGEKATELLPYTKDHGYGVNPIYDLAVTYAQAGALDKAFEQLEYNLSHPGYFTVAWLNADIRLKDLRNDPRFALLQRKYALKEAV
jgi:tetratricopeptide (TPR) repeat protein